MPIEFACDACSQQLRVPDGSQGQACRCPVCNQLLTIPASAAAADQLKAQRPDKEKPAAQLKIACPQCRFELICAPSLLGTKGQCRNCRTIFTIAENPVDRAVAGAGPGLIFNCPQCDQLFEGRAEMEGRKGKCHACGAVFAIALKPAHAASAVQPALQPTPQPTPQPALVATTATGRPGNIHPQPAFIRFSCSQCQGIMEVPGSTAGRTTECPYCQQRMPIPRQSMPQSSSAASTGKHFSAQRTTQAQIFPNALSSALGEVGSTADRGPAAGGAEPNPYAAPLPDPYLASDSSGVWDQPAPGRKLRGLTFGNAFELTFASLFPYCLVAAASFVLVAGLALGLVVAAGALAGAVVSALELDPRTTAGMIVIYSSVGVAVMVAVFLVTAVFCMTCNTALHVVRGRKVTGQVMFGTGESYGGMLVIMFGWTAFNILRDRGIPWIARSLADAGQPETAVTFALIAMGVLFVVQISLMLLLVFVPYALLDGQGLPDAMATSSSIFLGNFLTVLAVNVCGGLLYMLVSVLTCGVGAVVFIGGMLYLNAAVYKLANKH